MARFVYPVVLTPDVDGGFVVTFPDFPEAITQGETVFEALEEAADCLEEAVAGRLRRDGSIPMPSSVFEHQVALPALLAAKAALHLAMQSAGIENVELARRLGCDEKEIRRLRDPKHASRMSRIEAALAILGVHLVVDIQTAA